MVEKKTHYTRLHYNLRSLLRSLVLRLVSNAPPRFNRLTDCCYTQSSCSPSERINIATRKLIRGGERQEEEKLGPLLREDSN